MADGQVEDGVTAARREAVEEAGIELGAGRLIGQRNMNRPHDVRVARNDLPAYDIKEGDIFMVSTQAVRFDVPDLSSTNLSAGDDAEPGSARRVEIASLSRETVGIADHYDMLNLAMKGRSDGKSWKAASDRKSEIDDLER